MSSLNSISIEAFEPLVGRPDCPTVIDVRTEEDFATDPRLVPGTVRRPAGSAGEWADALDAATAVVVCQKGLKLSQGTAAWLRHAGVTASALDGGFAAWAKAGLPLVPAERMPAADARGRTVWVTRARPKIDRLACPWLIRRFVDRSAVFLFVNPADVPAVAERFGATPFDIEGNEVVWTHRGDRCTFDAMIEDFGLSTPAMQRLAQIVRGADTGRLDLAPESAGLLAVSLGLSRMYGDDLEQLEAAMPVYDALYRWCREATDETHNWPTRQAGA